MHPEVTTVQIDRDLALRILEVLRLDHIYTLLGSEFQEELGPDFKEHKWQGYVKQHAELATELHRLLQCEMVEQLLAHRARQ